jgi:hypothetical protein
VGNLSRSKIQGLGGEDNAASLRWPDSDARPLLHDVLSAMATQIRCNISLHHKLRVGLLHDPVQQQQPDGGDGPRSRLESFFYFKKMIFGVG